MTSPLTRSAGRFNVVVRLACARWCASDVQVAHTWRKMMTKRRRACINSTLAAWLITDRTGVTSNINMTAPGVFSSLSQRRKQIRFGCPCYEGADGWRAAALVALRAWLQVSVQPTAPAGTARGAHPPTRQARVGA